MMKYFKKGICLVMIASLLLLLCGCHRKPSDEALISRAKELLPKAQLLDTLFSVEGIPTMAGTEINNYLRADAAALAAYGFSSYSQIKEYARDIYTEAMFAQFEGMYVSSVSNGTTLSKAAYCYDATNKDGSFKALLVSKDGVHIKTDRVSYDLSTLKVTEKMRDAATLTLQATVTNSEGQQQSRTKRIRLVRQGDSWLLDSTTAIAFSRTN